MVESGKYIPIGVILLLLLLFWNVMNPRRYLCTHFPFTLMIFLVLFAEIVIFQIRFWSPKDEEEEIPDSVIMFGVVRRRVASGSPSPWVRARSFLNAYESSWIFNLNVFVLIHGLKFKFKWCLMPVLHLFQLLGQSVQNIRSGPSVSARASSIAVKEVFVFIFCIYSVDMFFLHIRYWWLSVLNC